MKPAPFCALSVCNFFFGGGGHSNTIVFVEFSNYFQVNRRFLSKTRSRRLIALRIDRLEWLSRFSDVARACRWVGGGLGGTWVWVACPCPIPKPG